MSKKTDIKDELFIIKEFIETPDGKKIRPDTYDKNKKFMSDIYPKLSDDVKNNLGYVLFKLHKGKMSLNKLAEKVITFSAEPDIENDIKEDKEMSKDKKNTVTFTIGEETKKENKKKKKSIGDIENILKEAEDTLEMALKESKEEKEAKSKDKESSKTKVEDDKIDIADIEKKLVTISNNINVEDIEEEEIEEDDFFGDDDDDEIEIGEEPEYDFPEYDFDDENDDYDYYGITPEFEKYKKDLEAFAKAQKSIEDLRDNLLAAKDTLSKEVYKENKQMLKSVKSELDIERDRLSKLNLQFFKDGTYARVNRHKHIPFKEGSKEWKQAIRNYDKVSVL